jgi:hypothetical protein
MYELQLRSLYAYNCFWKILDMCLREIKEGTRKEKRGKITRGREFCESVPAPSSIAMTVKEDSNAFSVFSLFLHFFSLPSSFSR